MDLTQALSILEDTERHVDLSHSRWHPVDPRKPQGLRRRVRVPRMSAEWREALAVVRERAT